MARPAKTINTRSWVGAIANAVNTITTTQSLISSIGPAEGTPRETLLRSRGNMLVVATPDAATDVTIAAFGLIVVHSNAASVGGTSLPGPVADSGADWLWHWMVPLDAVTLTAGDANARTVVERVVIDSKAMRRIPSDHVVALIGETSGGAFASVTVVAGLRLLLGH